MRPVLAMHFIEKLQQAESYHDVLRIFYGDVLTDDVIDTMLKTKTRPEHQNMYGSTMSRPRIAGVSDTMAFSVDQPSLQGTGSIAVASGATSDFVQDSPACHNCGDTSVSGSVAKQRRHRRRKNNNKADRRRRRNRGHSGGKRKGLGRKKMKQGKMNVASCYDHIINYCSSY